MRTLLTWAEAGRSPGDLGPVLRLLAVTDTRYDRARVVTMRAQRPAARQLARAMARLVDEVEIEVLPISDPSDYGALFTHLPNAVRSLPRDGVDVLLSAGTPQIQTLWVVMVQAGLLPARMLQVIPARFVPDPHPEPVREVRLDFDGFPEIRALRDEVVRLRARVAAVTGGLVGDSPPMRAVAERLARLAPARVPVLVLGETGTGKELVARALHDASPRADAPFVAENCGAFPEETLQSELFGHEVGAFTGADRPHRGLFEQAEGGTLFLDEVGELPPTVQVRLLRVLQERAVRRMGGESTRPVDVRVVAATHRDLRADVASGRFREDLYYRLRGAELRLPPLRDRAGDLERLVLHFLEEAGHPALRPTRSAWAALQRYGWPGNVRELRAEVLRWTVFCDAVVDVPDLAPEIAAPETSAAAAPEVAAPATATRTLADIVAAAERAAIDGALRAHDGNLSATARALAIDRNTLKRKMRAFGWR
jgi:DNA-binding NtrC family response regulator